eukprot:GABV01007860.1.p1 GENE.GABV01007860.1~~GABV01007860.1.p1  ORF type:complete len:139 (-),score=34.95 GABV01007860.1:3-419(-)
MSTPTTTLFEEEEEHDSGAILGLFGIAAFILLSSYLYEETRMRKLQAYLPHSSMMLIVGIIIGGILKGVGLDLDEFKFDDELFFLVFLPPIIFAGGYTVRKDFFFYNLGTIFLFALLGTVLMAFLLVAWRIRSVPLDA